MNNDSANKESVVIDCSPDNFEETISGLKQDGAKFITMAASRDSDGVIALVYYFQLNNKMLVITLVPKEKSMPSLYSSFQKADFIEREIYSLFEIKFIGHPNLAQIDSEEIEEQIYNI